MIDSAGNATKPEAVTRLIRAIEAGEAGQDEQLVTWIVTELRAIAAQLLRRERRDHSLLPTDLVHEAYVKLFEPTRLKETPSRGVFLAAASQAMQRLLVDHARRRNAIKRGGKMQRAGDPIETLAANTEALISVDLLELHERLETLRGLHKRQHDVVQMKFFGGLKLAEISEALNVHVHTVSEDWRMARAWLHDQLS